MCTRWMLQVGVADRVLIGFEYNFIRASIR